MKLAMLSGQNSIHTIRWANALASSGSVTIAGRTEPIQVHLLSMHAPKHQHHPQVTLHPLPWRAPFGYLLNLPAIQKILQQIQPDILHTHYATGYGSLGALTGFRPQVLSVWGSDVYDFPQASQVHRRLVAHNLQQADWVCSTSHVMAAQTLSLQANLAQLSIIPFGVETDKFCPRPDQRPEQQPDQRQNEQITIGTVKTLAPKYGIDTLIQGFARLRQQLQASHPDVAQKLRLLLVGDGPQRAALETLVQQLGLASVVTFAGFIPHPQVPEALNQLDIYVASSRLDSESFGVAVIEASACGVPVVVTDVGGLPEVVVDGVTGRIVRREDPTALANALEGLVLDPALRQRMGEQGRQHVVTHYQWHTCVVQMQEVYEKLLARALA
jgi:L-malate glycosyltransferase